MKKVFFVITVMGLYLILCNSGISQVNGTATLVRIRRDNSYIYFDFDVEIVLPGC